MSPRADEASRLRAGILRWYRKHRRDLPWRRTRDPYSIWVSEIMLQQTRVDTVIPFYNRFLERFPDVASLARARDSEVLSAWSGLGYYRRARNMRAAATLMVREHAGGVPDDTGALRRLPGVGEYTAAAISSVAFGKPAAAVDGNVVRVLARIGGLTGRRDSSVLRREVTRRAMELASGPDPGDWTQALMELGATVCLPRDPLCARCPARPLCRAAEGGDPDRYPERAVAAKPKIEHRVMLVARDRGCVLLVPDEGERGTAWTLPNAAVPGDAATGGRRASAQATASRLAAVALARTVGRTDEPRGPLARFKHRTFSHDLTVEVWELDPRAPRAARGATPAGARWVPPARFESIPMRAPTLKALNKLRG